MKATVESTGQLVELEWRSIGERPVARVWIGRTEQGTEFQILVVRVAAAAAGDQREFERDLSGAHAPVPAPAAFPLRMLL